MKAKIDRHPPHRHGITDDESGGADIVVPVHRCCICPGTAEPVHGRRVHANLLPRLERLPVLSDPEHHRDAQGHAARLRREPPWRLRRPGQAALLLLGG